VPRPPSILRIEWPLIAVAVTTLLFVLFGNAWLADLSRTMTFVALSLWLFAAMMTSSPRSWANRSARSSSRWQ
jgi:hypothetical protein